ncbi:hypothetical protein CFR80_14625 [Komagataeibacter oboediens]|uniref:Conjugal transfer protein TrbC n=2 Tax=Acetobacteraceae TaxID=433 RepID=A0A318QL68_9PROT|nr:hypothetical protein CFR80_14625 [Komagataeibacter oboediens]
MMMAKKSPAVAGAAVALAPASQAFASPGYSVQTQGSGILSNIASTMQDIGNFMSTTMGELAVVGGFVVAALLWAFAPKSGAVGYAVRAAIAAIIIFNITAVIAYFTY